jgi:hypothetical protein
MSEEEGAYMATNLLLAGNLSILLQRLLDQFLTGCSRSLLAALVGVDTLGP